MKKGINLKITAIALLLVIIPSSIIGIVGYSAAKTAYYNGINERLKDQANDWHLLIDAYDDEIVAQNKRARHSAESIVTAQAKMTYELVDSEIKKGSGTLDSAAKEDLLNRLNRNTVGKTGYIWIVDYDGNYVLSKGRQRDGENILESKDASGNPIGRTLVDTGKAIKGSDIALLSYMWLNKGETNEREKISAMVSFPQLRWIVGISTYYDDVVDMGYKERTIENVKNLISQQTIGNSGYIWVVNSKGEYQVSKNRIRDGENIFDSKDFNGNPFIQEAITKAKEAHPETDLIIYPWLNKGESESRLKVAGLSYNADWDWVIGVSAYYDDFRLGDLALVKDSILLVLLVSLVLGTALAFIAANRISSPLRKMVRAGRRVADGDLDAEIPEINSKDEVEELGLTMSMLVGAIKFLKKEKHKKK